MRSPEGPIAKACQAAPIVDSRSRVLIGWVAKGFGVEPVSDDVARQEAERRRRLEAATTQTLVLT